MKKILLLILFIFSFSALAENVNYTPDGKESFVSKKECKKKHDKCYKIKVESLYVDYDLVDEYVNDYEKPEWGTRSMITACTGEEDCKAKALELECVDGRWSLYNAEYSEVWCNKITGYAQKATGRKHLVINESKKQSRLNSEALEKQKSMAISQALKRMDKGRKVIGLMLVRNSTKTLTKKQIRLMNKTYSEVKDLLETGSLESAHEAINELVPDGVLVTAEDKTALLSELTTLMGQ